MRAKGNFLNKNDFRKLKDEERIRFSLIELAEMVLGLGAVGLMGYFFYTKGYGVLIGQIWSSLFG